MNSIVKTVKQVLSDKVLKVRSKNAGPFWITVDVFCGSSGVFDEVSTLLKTEQVANLYKVEVGALDRYDIPDLYVIKFSFPRPEIQGSRYDRDMHGAQAAVLLSEMSL